MRLLVLLVICLMQGLLHLEISSFFLSSSVRGNVALCANGSADIGWRAAGGLKPSPEQGRRDRVKGFGLSLGFRDSAFPCFLRPALTTLRSVISTLRPPSSQLSQLPLAENPKSLNLTMKPKPGPDLVSNRMV